MDNNLSPEHFQLIRKVLRETSRKEQDRPLKRKRRKVHENSTKDPEPKVTISIDSSDSDSRVEDKPEVVDLQSASDAGKEETYEDEGSEDYDDSDEFEDVTEPVTFDAAGVLSVTIAPKQETKKGSGAKARNICSNEERQRRRYYHMAYLLCLMVHGAIVNDWINNSKLLRKLSKLIDENLFNLLHPEKDDQMPLRSTRKLLDGLKKCMELWQKHWKVKKRYSGLEYYMRSWQETDGPIDLKKTLTENEFVRRVLKGHGNCDLATQGFVALLRSCNVNARLVMSCQPPDFTNLKEQESPTSRADTYSNSFKYPIFWCEVWDKFTKKWITIDPTNLKTIEQVRNGSKLEPRGVSACRRNMMRYVIGLDRKNGCKDITRRYASWFNSKCRKRRITNSAPGSEWYDKVICALHRRKRTRIDDYEEEYFNQRDEDEGMPDNLQDLKNHPKFVLEKDIRINQVLKPNSKECGYLNVNHGRQVLKVFDRKDLIDLKSAKQWYMEGRILKVGSRVRKTIKKSKGRMRSMTGIDGEVEEERLYSIDDTELYHAPLASSPDGKIEKNAYGNIEVFVPSMIPANCCLIESPNAIKAAKFLEVEYARAVCGFKFERGNSSKPIIGGVVVAKWFVEAVVSAIDGIEYSLEVDERQKQELKALEDWNVLLLKIRIKSNLNATYGQIQEHGTATNKDDINDSSADDSDFEAPAGGFLPVPNADTEAAQPTMTDSDEHEKLEPQEEGGFVVAASESKLTSVKHDRTEGTCAAKSQKSLDLDEKSEADEETDGSYEQFMEELDFSDQDS
ncbi:hypothetical protein HG536_0A06070 [Torulaspora globosa]|uniref:Transglutaminase-like domain-containing protein n=1 Tax=Torulaspora globosa TaxID=48254 RepID=A0A7G3ZBA6_9SACH|nr:uncharacterized protein HG536_0A06070 [Torulaspora globosa]QLL30792.1 hypothetical protein HG536_0A06070 [Torulaspora globosa]